METTYLHNQMNTKIEHWLSRLKIKELNLMQKAVLDSLALDQDILLVSPTGSGKTLAFLLYILHSIDLGKTRITQAMIVVPTRELAQQIEANFRLLQTGLKVTSCYGGHKREIEENALTEAPVLVIGTPGRLGDHIRRGNLQLDQLDSLVLDEFDKTLESGFEEEMKFIVSSTSGVRRKILTSATISKEIPAFLNLDQAKLLDFPADRKEDELGLEIKRYPSQDKDKAQSLFNLICQLGNRPTIIFCNHRESVERLHQYLREKGIVAVYYHGAMEQRDRDLALAKFRNGSSYVLVTTDLAARGLDVAFIRYIIHYHLPLNQDSFIHRNGRTARMKSSGTAILLLSEEEKVPAYVDQEVSEIQFSLPPEIPAKPKWVTLFLGAGKKEKINKVDIVGFLSKKGKLSPEDIGIIEVRDYSSFVGIRKSKMAATLPLIQKEKIKNKRVKIDILKQ